MITFDILCNDGLVVVCGARIFCTIGLFYPDLQYRDLNPGLESLYCSSLEVYVRDL